MSISHNVELREPGGARIVLNIVGLDGESQHVDELYGAFFAYDVSGTSLFTAKLSLEDLRLLHSHLHRHSVIADPTKSQTGTFVELPTEVEALRAALTSVQPAELLPVLRELLATRLTRPDINVILGRKDALEEFKTLLSLTDTGEPSWQEFFERNDWIFGYGLRYCYLRILQREAHISGVDLSGRGAVISDFLLTDSRFTKLVEIKRPDTPLFKNRSNRSDSWCLSDELTDAVSQILAQQANWEIESQKEPIYTNEGQRLSETAIDVECILVVGSLSEVSGSERERQVKLKTFELFRRNLRNVAIITYDELYQRARFIVFGGESTGE